MNDDYWKSVHRAIEAMWAVFGLFLFMFLASILLMSSTNVRVAWAGFILLVITAMFGTAFCFRIYRKER